MGKFNSSLTRVKPLFDFINCNSSKMDELFSLFNKDNSETFIEISKCHYGDNEKGIPPTKAMLMWYLDNIDKLTIHKNYGVSVTSPAYEHRRILFSQDLQKINEAKALLSNTKLLKNKWFIFEGYTYPDIYFESNNKIYIGEAKRTESKLTTSTKWLKMRDQLIRHIDSVIDSDKEIVSFFIIENPNLYDFSVYENFKYFQKNLPYRDKQSIEKAYQSFIGYCTWDEISNKLGIIFDD